MRLATPGLAASPITAGCFPTPALILRTNDPAAQQCLREFARKQAEAARRLHQALTERLCEASDIHSRVTAFTAVFHTAEHWRYLIAAVSPHPTGRYAAAHVERFRTPVTDDIPNLFRIGEPERFTDGALWNPITRTYEPGAETPASRTMRQFEALAATRFPPSSGDDVVTNRITLPDGSAACGTLLLRGDAARRASTEMTTRIAARGGDTSRIITDGHLIYAASPPETDRRAIFHHAMTLLAQHHATRAAASTAWLWAAYLLYQAPRRKRGGDAVIRTFLIATGTYLLGHPPRLVRDIDLRAYVRPPGQFVAELQAAQDDSHTGTRR